MFRSMNSIKEPLLHQEKLEQIEFERSKKWAKLLKQYETTNAESSLELTDSSNSLPDHNDCNIKEAEEIDVLEDDDVLQDITNSSCLGMKRKPGPSSTIVQERHTNVSDDETAELQDILNHTRPIIAEHERKWKEAGIDRILNTFDTEKIEEKVGGWLRRNNSVYSQLSPCDTILNINGKQNYDDLDNSAESEHSDDTARYILANRKRRSSTCMTTMTIKTFRMVKSKRNALYEKYACPELDDTNYLKSGCSEMMKKRLQKVHHHNPICRSKCGLAEKSRDLSKRRRALRIKTRTTKVSDDVDSSMSSSCEELSYSVNKLEKRCGIKKHRLKLSKKHRDYRSARSGYKQNYSSNSSTHNSFDHAKSLRTVDQRPCKRESECSCCNDEKLCEAIRHMADTSTEDWFVENYSSPKKLLLPKNSVKNMISESLGEDSKNTKKSQISSNSISRNGKAKKRGIDINSLMKTTNNNSTEKFINEKRSSQKISNSTTAESSSVKNKLLNQEKMDAEKVNKECDQIASKSNIKNDKTSNDIKDKDTATISDSSFEREIRKAIKISKKMYAEEMKKNAKINQKQPDIEEKPKKGSLASTKETKNVKSKKSKRDTMQTINENCILQEKQQKYQSESIRQETQPIVPVVKSQHRADDTFFSNASKIYNSTAIGNDISKNKAQHLKEKSRKVKGDEIQTMSLKNETFFGSSNKICNSTPLPNGSKNKEQQFINAKKRQLGLAAACSSTSVREPQLDNKNKTPVNKRTENNDNDCTVVTSTTCSPQNKQHNDILLYTPLGNTSAPAESVYDGTFHITKDHLTTVIGKTQAELFLKYYTQRRWFDKNSTVYYRPPQSTETFDSSDDGLDLFDQYGELYEIPNNRK